MHKLLIILILLSTAQLLFAARELNVSTRPTPPSISELDIVLLFDSSSSVSPNALDNATKACALWIYKQSMGSFGTTKFAVVQFSDTAVALHSMSDNASSVIKMIDGVQSLSGGTNYALALNAASQLFNREAHKVVFLFSDGLVDNDGRLNWFSWTQIYGSVLESLKSLSVQGIHLFGFRIEDSQEPFLEGFEHVHDLAELGKVYDSIVRSVDKTNEQKIPRIRVAFEQLSNSSVGKPVILNAKITNTGRTNILNGSVVHVADNSYFLKTTIRITETLAPGASFAATFSLKTAANAGIKEFPATGFVPVAFSDPAWRSIESSVDGFFLATQHLLEDMLNIQPVDKTIPAFNIILVGPKGTGKSSLINSILTSISGSRQVYAPTGAQTTGTRTKEIIRTPLWRGFFPDIKANLWDTWGIVNANFTDDLFKEILSGQIPSGYSLSDWHGDSKTESKYPAEEELHLLSSKEREIHAVVFVISPDSYITETMDYVTSLNEVALDRGYNPLFVITHADQYHNESYRLDLQKKMSTTFSVSEASVFFIANYVNENTKNSEKDRMSYEVFSAALSAADSFLKKKTIQRSVCDPNCLNGGICVMGKCECLVTGFEGRICEKPACRPVCENGGVCVEPNLCECPAWVFGRTCKISFSQVAPYVGPVVVAIVISVVVSLLLSVLLKVNRQAPVRQPIVLDNDFSDSESESENEDDDIQSDEGSDSDGEEAESSDEELRELRQYENNALHPNARYDIEDIDDEYDDKNDQDPCNTLTPSTNNNNNNNNNVERQKFSDNFVLPGETTPLSSKLQNCNELACPEEQGQKEEQSNAAGCSNVVADACDDGSAKSEQIEEALGEAAEDIAESFLDLCAGAEANVEEAEAQGDDKDNQQQQQEEVAESQDEKVEDEGQQVERDDVDEERIGLLEEQSNRSSNEHELDDN